MNTLFIVVNVIKIIVGCIVYLGFGYLGAAILTKLWRSNQTKEEPNKEQDYDKSGESLVKPKKSDSALLTICQYFCILLGPVVPCIVIFGIFSAYLILSIISVIAWGVKWFKER